jgi:uncharacterized protein
MGLGEQLRQAREEVRDEWSSLHAAGAEAGPGDRSRDPLRFELRHAVPGRLRAAFPLLIHRQETIERVASTLRERPGVRRVSSNRFCASLTIDYDAERLPESSLLEGMKRLKVEDLAPGVRPTPETRLQKGGPAQARPEPGRRTRILWTAAGTLFVGMSGLGVVLPGLPTAPFVLLAAYCYLRGSRRLYRWLVNHRVFGRFVEETETGVRISRKAKKATVILLWVSIAISCVFFLQALPLRLLLISIGGGVSVYLLRKPA